MGKVTYILGAGASANCLPVVNDIPKKLLEFADKIEEIVPHESATLEGGRPDYNFRKYSRKLQNACKKFASKCSAITTIDSYAREISFTDPYEYREIKSVLTALFTYIQFITQVDYRYSTFLDDLLKTGNASSIQKDVIIISWNYDFQLEKAYSRHFPNHNIEVLKTLLQIDGRETANPNKFRAYQVNGNLSYIDSDGVNRYMIDEVDRQEDISILIKRCLKYYEEINDGLVKSQLLFAYDEKRELENNEILAGAIKHVSDSDALVVIGYTFPQSNREHDTMLLKKLSHPNLKIYIQNPVPGPIRELMELHFDFLPLENIKNYLPTSYFLIPPNTI